LESFNHGQSNEKKQDPLLSGRHEIVIDHGQNKKKKRDTHHSARNEVVILTSPVDPETETEPQLATSERAMMDYISLKGIQNRTGFTANQLLLYVLKELIDNGLDFIDKYAGKVVGSSDLPELSISVRKQSGRITIRVANSDFGLDGFTLTMLESIFDFNGFFSSKRNLFKVSRGALGDALKEVICVPVALADSNDMPSWNEPLLIESGKNVFVIHLDVDKVNRRLGIFPIEVKQRSDSSHNFTVVEVTLPAVRNLDLDIQSFLENYSLLNTHLSLNFDLSLGGDKQNENVTLKFPACQKPIPSSNLSSTHYCTFAEFKNFILGLDDNSMPAYRALQIFREGSNIKKDAVPETLGELKKNPEKMKELYQDLRIMMKPSAKIITPFSTSKKVREQALIDRIEQFGYTVSNIRFASRQFNYNREVQFPFLVEAAIIDLDEVPYNLLYVEGTNCSHRPYITFLSGRLGTFKWRTKNGKIHSTANVFEILEKHGYSHYPEKCKNPGTIFYINLISPRFDYQNYAKTTIDLKPFAEAIADTIYKVCSTKKDFGITANYYARDTAEGLLTELLESRLEEIESEPGLIHTDRWTQSTVYYRLRPQLIKKGIDVQRKYITSQIRRACEKTLGKTRAELGIVAADRAQLYFRGQWYDVGLDELDQLMHLGTDMLIIEKEGVAEVLSPFADKMGIALLNTRGFLTEYATMLSSLSKENGCNVAILTDFDVSGLLLARKVPGVYRIGIDFDTLNYFRLNLEDVEEQYKAENNHLKPLQEMGPAEGEDEITFTKNLEYITNKRIEIDSILAKIGNEPFWKYLIQSLVNRFPKRNYNRSIDVPKYVMPDIIGEFLNKIKNKIVSTVRSEYELIKDELLDSEGTFDNVNEEEEKITTRFKTAIEKDEKLLPILTKVQKLSDEIETS
jgi:hypothetical protein